MEIGILLLHINIRKHIRLFCSFLPIVNVLDFHETTLNCPVFRTEYGRYYNNKNVFVVSSKTHLTTQNISN